LLTEVPEPTPDEAVTAVLLDVVERHRADAPDVDAIGLGP
jgi:predicted NBD/HSP70 family sugar kinase